MIRLPWRHYFRQARDTYARAEADDPKVDRAVEKALELKRRNGFMAAIDRTFGGAAS